MWVVSYWSKDHTKEIAFQTHEELQTYLLQEGVTSYMVRFIALASEEVQ